MAIALIAAICLNTIIQIKEIETRAIVAPFLNDLQANKPEAAHARVKQWVDPLFNFKGTFVAYWQRLLIAHGPVQSIEIETIEGPQAVALIEFEREKYYLVLAIGDDGQLIFFKFFPPNGGQLVWASHGVAVKAEDAEKPQEGSVTFAVPGLYRGQVPLSLKVAADPPEALKNYKLRLRDDGINYVCDATVNPGKKGAIIYWEATVLVGLGPDAPMVLGPAQSLVDPVVKPEHAKWLRSTNCVQIHPVLRLANELHYKSKSILNFADIVEEWVDKNKGTGKPLETLDAAAAVECGGSCTSRANLAAALLRSKGFPARTVAHLPVGIGPLYVHWQTEYWHPQVGWIELHPAKLTHGTGQNVILNVANPEDEDDCIWPNRRSGIMDGAPRLSGRELNGPIRWVSSPDLRTWGLAVPLALSEPRFTGDWRKKAELDELWKLAREAHKGLVQEGIYGEFNPKRVELTKIAQKEGAAGLIKAFRPSSSLYLSDDASWLFSPTPMPTSAIEK